MFAKAILNCKKYTKNNKLLTGKTTSSTTNNFDLKSTIFQQQQKNIINTTTTNNSNNTNYVKYIKYNQNIKLSSPITLNKMQQRFYPAHTIWCNGPPIIPRYNLEPRTIHCELRDNEFSFGHKWAEDLRKNKGMIPGVINRGPGEYQYLIQLNPGQIYSFMKLKGSRFLGRRYKLVVKDTNEVFDVFPVSMDVNPKNSYYPKSVNFNLYKGPSSPLKPKLPLRVQLQLFEGIGSKYTEKGRKKTIEQREAELAAAGVLPPTPEEIARKKLIAEKKAAKEARLRKEGKLPPLEQPKVAVEEEEEEEAPAAGGAEGEAAAKPSGDEDEEDYMEEEEDEADIVWDEDDFDESDND